jgi:hypothetical protein
MRPKGSAEVLAARRHRALKLLDEGLSLNEVARRILGGCLKSGLHEKACRVNSVVILGSSTAVARPS